MFSRRLISLGVACLAFGVSAVHAQTPLTFQQALATARDRAPRVAVARARIEEERGRLVGAQVRFRDNPVIDASAGPRWLETGTVTDYAFMIRRVHDPIGRMPPVLCERTGQRYADDCGKK